MFLPLDPVEVTVTTGIGNCEYEISVVEPHGVQAGACDFCNADVCVAAALEAVDTAVADATPDASPDGPGATTDPDMVPTDDDEPLSLPAVISIMSVGSLSGLVVLWFQFKRRRRRIISEFGENVEHVVNGDGGSGRWAGHVWTVIKGFFTVLTTSLRKSSPLSVIDSYFRQAW